MARTNYRFIVITAIVLFVIWSAVFIENLSFIAIDGNRHLSLADDAMISMRYAWNLSHGFGLVWNIGERVEGYSNLLMTLVMALATWLFDKENAVLFIQIIGVPTIVLSAWVASRIASLLFKDYQYHKAVVLLSFLGVLLYYPLAHWTLIGMETGLTTLLVLLGVYFALKWLQDNNSKNVYAAAISFGLAFLARNDVMIFAAPVFFYLYYEAWRVRKTENGFRQMVLASIIFGIFVIGQLIFRIVYYGDILPNTYYLKVSKIPISVRLNDGLLYVQYISKYSLILFLLATANIFINPTLRKFVLFTLPVLSLLYLIWTGGDVYSYWRFIIPVVPILVIFAGSTVVHLALKASSKKNITFSFGEWTAIMLFMLVIIAPYWQVFGFQDAVLHSSQNKNNMDVAIAISELTAPEARIGVYTAGLIPYYTGRYSIDFLGKCDPYIARTYPHLPSKITWFEKITAPGHNKYDLAYSIKKLQPDYVQRFRWAKTNIREWAVNRYIRVEYEGENGTKTLLLKKDSPFIFQEKGKVLSWGE